MKKLKSSEINNVSAGKNERIKVKIGTNEQNKYELFTERVLGEFESEEEALKAVKKCAANGIDSVKWKK